MIVADLQELKLFPVADRGVPNQERVPIQVLRTTDMGQFGLLVGISSYQKLATPVQDNLFWFGDGLVNAGDWILLYTGSGTARTDDWTTPPGSKVYSVHWGRPTTIFANSSVVPILFAVQGADVGLSPSDLPQLGALGP
jgi:hypothetical protein